MDDLSGIVGVAPCSAFELTFLDEDGGTRRASLRSCWSTPFEVCRPVRLFPSSRGQRNWPGFWWSATTGGHVGYESWVERDVAMMLDFDPAVTGFASQPFWLVWSDGTRERRHVPDFFARLCDGTGVVVDVRPADRVDDKAAEVFAVTEKACAEVGWQFRLIGELPAAWAANLRWLSGYRHRRCYDVGVAERLVKVFGEPTALLTGAEMVGDRIAVLPVLYHLLWRQVLIADLRTAPLTGYDLVRAVRR